jgi:hypothetical protein
MRTHHDTGQDLAVLTRLLQDLATDMPPGHQRRLREYLVTEVREAGPARPRLAGRLRASRPGGRAPRRVRVVLGTAAATVALATAAAVILTSPGGPVRPVSSKGAAQLLAKVADAAARQPAPRVRDSQYTYTETVVAYPSPAPPMSGPYPRRIHLARMTSQTWAPVADVCRTGLERSTTAGGHVSSAPFTAGGTGMKCPSIGGLNDPTYRLLQTLPINPRALLVLIYRAERGHGSSPDQEAFVTIGDLLRRMIAPPKVTAALYRAAALIPGVTLIPDAPDAIGRPGVAVARTGPGADGGVSEELIFGKSTLRLIGERTVIVRTGVTTSATAIIARAFASHLGQVPHGTPAPAS